MHPCPKHGSEEERQERPIEGEVFGPLGLIVPCLHEFLHPGMKLNRHLQRMKTRMMGCRSIG